MAVEERRAEGAAHLPSLVVCPSTLVLHWAHEVAKFAAEGALRTLAYQGAPQVPRWNKVSKCELEKREGLSSQLSSRAQLALQHTRAIACCI